MIGVTRDTGPLAVRIASIAERVERAADAAGRDASEITTVVVTKFQPVELLEDLYSLGVRDFGESRHQEAKEKAAALPGDIRWHFVGQLQSKKARAVREYASVIHSVDRISLVDALASDDLDVGVFAQINLTDDPARGGVAPSGLDELVESIQAAPGMRLKGVMAVPPLEEDPARSYARLRELSERVMRAAPTASAISAGMSGDFEQAVSAGATHLRIGTAITGERTRGA
ncbi:YggS family pyridoxal phosphate-dependent enzyme [Amnibacterium flavum]|uniref:Pyridoxal phosphate homeostasis protein n=1 Tax=Amnibacterium flavum TaxID=2173173 RepID=A0A2V1HPZ9_9MICO|nr:YggS family pyridoxal phosphate-dependent enzyme [Amnibacterium flavum]PVZ94676.1 YggS family pyridoxal phosphate-dependent enzyme [Amnibacterium flavum]